MNTPDVKHLPLKIIHDLAHPADIQPAVYRQQVTDTLRDLRARGFGGVVTNVSTQHNYLESDREWALLAVLADACTAEGMRLWIYDERFVTIRTARRRESCASRHASCPVKRDAFPCRAVTESFFLPVCMPAPQTERSCRGKTVGMNLSARRRSGMQSVT